MTDPKDTKTGPKVVAMRRSTGRGRGAAPAGRPTESLKLVPGLPEPAPAPVDPVGGAAPVALWSSVLEPYVTAACGAAMALLDLQLALMCRNEKLLERRLQLAEAELRELQGLAAALLRAEDPLSAARLQLEHVAKLLESGFAQGAAGLDYLEGCLASGSPAPATTSVSDLAAHRLSPGSALKH